MAGFLSFVRAQEALIYVLLALAGLIFISKFIRAWQGLQEANFGLERDIAQTRLNSSASVMVLLLTMAVTTFVLVSFVAPAFPESAPLFTPTLNLLATPTITLAPGSTGPETGVLGLEPLTAEVIEPTPPPSPACIAGQIDFTFPEDGQEVRGAITVTGNAVIENFAFYKLEVKRPGEQIWLTILAGDDPVVSGELGKWDTSHLTPSEYELGLVLVNSQAQSMQPCIIRIRVAPVENSGF
jgi:hypothetical protein